MASEHATALRDFRDVYRGTIADESLRQYVQFDTEMINDFRGGDNANDIALGDFIRDYRAATVDLIDDLLAARMPPADASREINECIERYEVAYENRFSDEAKIQTLLRWERKNGDDGPDYGETDEALASEKIKRVAKAILMSPHYLIYILILTMIAMLVRGYLVPSGSMIPTLRENDRILTLKRYFPDGHTYIRGDIVCFHEPKAGEVYVKRIVAVGGDEVVVNDQGLFINGELSPYQGGGTSSQSGTWKLDDDEYFMMGDNRVNSQDSRYIGAIKASAVIGKVDFIYWPLDRFTKFDGSGLFGL